MRLRIFGTLSIVSLLLFAAVVWMWVRSFHENVALCSWVRTGELFTLRSHWGQLVVVGPPVGQDPEVEAIARRMSVADFEWTVAPAYVRRPGWEVMPARGYVQGEVRDGTPTREMYAWLREVQSRTELTVPPAATRAWLRGLEDPRRLPSSHLLLTLAAQHEWRERWGDARPERRDDATIERGRLLLFMSADEARTGPDLSKQAELRDRWHARVGEARLRLFYGWVAAGALVLPIAWAARPRRRELTTKGRWVFNRVALVSTLLLLGSGGMWVRSYRASDQWTFASELREPPAGRHWPVLAQWWVGSADGRFSVYASERPVPQHVGPKPRPEPVGYSRAHAVATAPAFVFPGARAAGEQHWEVPGVKYRAISVQQLTRPGAGTSAYFGFRHLVMSWGVIVALTAIVPLMWTWRQWRWWGREQRTRKNQCRNCGYDLRASAERCPECGMRISVEAGA